jgi:hypothetical protein
MLIPDGNKMYSLTPEGFENLWLLNYSSTLPISHVFKHEYTDRWFRIHSLPDSKRYAEDDEDWFCLLNRQNEILCDLFHTNSKIFIVTGEYNSGVPRVHITENDEIFKSYKFQKLNGIDLYKADSDNYDEGQLYLPAFAETIWCHGRHDMLLREIAMDNARAFFVSFDLNVIAAPYDGGVDFILKDDSTKYFYKNKYKQYLSLREDGF